MSNDDDHTEDHGADHGEDRLGPDGETKRPAAGSGGGPDADLLERMARMEDLQERHARLLRRLQPEGGGGVADPAHSAGPAAGGAGAAGSDAGVRRPGTRHGEPQSTDDSATAGDDGRAKRPANLAANPSQWTSVPESQRRTWWFELAAWVDWLTATYDLHTERRKVPPCWWRHPVAAQHLAALWHAHRGAHASTAGPDEPIRWHINWLWPTVHRLEELRVFASCTLSEHKKATASLFAVEVAPSAASEEFRVFVETGGTEHSDGLGGEPGGARPAEPARSGASRNEGEVIDVTALEELDDDLVAGDPAEDGLSSPGAHSRRFQAPTAAAAAGSPRVAPVRGGSSPAETSARLGRASTRAASTPGRGSDRSTPGAGQFAPARAGAPQRAGRGSTPRPPAARPHRDTPVEVVAAAASAAPSAPMWASSTTNDAGLGPVWTAPPEPSRPLSELALGRAMIEQVLAAGEAVAMLDDYGSPVRIHGTWWTTSTGGAPAAGAGAEPWWTAVADPAANAQLDAMWSHQVAGGRPDEDGTPTGRQR